MIDLVITEEGGKYIVRGGPESAIFTGSRNNHDEAIGSWVRQNREAIDFLFSFIEDGEFKCSTVYGFGRPIEQLGLNETKAFEEFNKRKK